MVCAVLLHCTAGEGDYGKEMRFPLPVDCGDRKQMESTWVQAGQGEG